MKKLNAFTVSILILLMSTLSSCEAIASIFKAGMGFGIFLVIAVVVLIIFIAMRAGKNKNS